MVVLEVKGVSQVLSGLRVAKNKLGHHADIGMKKAATMLMRESLKIVPVQTGALKASWDIRKSGTGVNAVYTLGYFGVLYGAYVHEIPNIPPHGPTHGQEFNIKHLEEIIAAGRWSSDLKTHRTTFEPYGFAGTAQGGMFPRKPEEQYKYLEKPVRENQKEVLNIIRTELMKAK